MKKQQLRIATVQCESCSKWDAASATTCRHCSQAFSPDQIERQTAFKRSKSTTVRVNAIGLSVLAVAVVALVYHEIERPLTPTEISGRNERERSWAKILATASAGAAVKERMKNPPSFDLVEADANPTRLIDGKPGWLVAVTYRGTNSFGGVVTSRALVWIDEAGNTPLKVVDVSGGPG